MNYDMLMAKLRPKLDVSYQDYVTRSAAWPLQERQEYSKEIQNTEFVYDALLNEGGTEPQLRYLLHFKNPLEVVVDQISVQRALGSNKRMGELEYALQRLLDTRDADGQYEMEDAFRLPEGSADELLNEIAGRAEVEYHEYLKSLEALPPKELVQRATEIADMERLHSTLINDSYNVLAADLCFLWRAEKPLREFYDFLYGQEELSALDSFASILSAYNDVREEAALLGEWKAPAATEAAAEPEDPEERLRQRIDMEYDALERAWKKLKPGALIEKAREIAAVQLVRDALAGYEYQDGEVEGLLRFQNPLSLAANYWNNSDSPTDEEVWEDLPYVLSSISENEPAPQEEGQTEGLGLC